MPPLKGNVVVGQSGGPTVVINQSLVGIVEACLEADEIGEIYGAVRGVQGVLDEDFIDLKRQKKEDLEAVASTPCAALRSVRKKPTREDCERALAVFRAHDVRYFFYIGGNDTAETAMILNEVAVADGYELRLFHVPKTIDNDLCETDHCPGYGSAARFVAQALMGDNQDNKSLGGIKIDVIMGRHAGWLTAASVLGRQHANDGPQLVYLPEVDFEVESFVRDVQNAWAQHGRCVIAVSEGIHDADGRLIAESGESDVFGNVQLSGSGALGDKLAAIVRENVVPPKGVPLRVRADTFGYLQRSYFGVVSDQDAREAREVGRVAVRVATSGKVPHGSIVILREGNGASYAPRYDVAPLERVGGHTKHMPAELLAGTSDVAPAFLDYALPLVGPLPRPGRLEPLAVPKRL
ncbi:MAG: 6-phosphofructokinase [bacterium]|nr:6-phosphofructokinase [bacterium]